MYPLFGGYNFLGMGRRTWGDPAFANLAGELHNRNICGARRSSPPSFGGGYSFPGTEWFAGAPRFVGLFWNPGLFIPNFMMPFFCGEGNQAQDDYDPNYYGDNSSNNNSRSERSGRSRERDYGDYDRDDRDVEESDRGERSSRGSGRVSKEDAKEWKESEGVDAAKTYFADKAAGAGLKPPKLKSSRRQFILSPKKAGDPGSEDRIKYAEALKSLYDTDERKAELKAKLDALPDGTTLVLGPDKAKIKKDGPVDIDKVIKALEGWDPKTESGKAMLMTEPASIRYFTEKHSGDGKSEGKPLMSYSEISGKPHLNFDYDIRTMKPKVDELTVDNISDGFIAGMKKLLEQGIVIDLWGKSFKKSDADGLTKEIYLQTLKQELNAAILPDEGPAPADTAAGELAAESAPPEDSGLTGIATYADAIKAKWAEISSNNGIEDGIDITKYFSYFDVKKYDQSQAEQEMVKWGETYFAFTGGVTYKDSQDVRLYSFANNTHRLEVPDSLTKSALVDAIVAKVEGLENREKLITMQAGNVEIIKATTKLFEVLKASHIPPKLNKDDGLPKRWRVQAIIARVSLKRYLEKLEKIKAAIDTKLDSLPSDEPLV